MRIARLAGGQISGRQLDQLARFSTLFGVSAGADPTDADQLRQLAAGINDTIKVIIHLPITPACLLRQPLELTSGGSVKRQLEITHSLSYLPGWQSSSQTLSQYSAGMGNTSLHHLSLSLQRLGKAIHTTHQVGLSPTSTRKILKSQVLR
jgi:hypothetical protein